MIIFFVLIGIGILIGIALQHKVEFQVDASMVGVEYQYCIHIRYFVELATIYREDLSKRRKTTSSWKWEKWMYDAFQVEHVDFQVRVGLGDAFVTSMVVPLLSTVLAIALQVYLPNSTKTFSIRPVYNEFFFSVKGVAYLSIPLKDLLSLLFWRLEKATSKKDE